MQLEQVPAGQTVFKLSHYPDDTCEFVSDNVQYGEGSSFWISSAYRKRDRIG